MLPERSAQVLTAIVVLLVLVGFAGLFGVAIAQVWSSTSKPTYNEGFLYVATGAATLVGGVMAVAFNVRPPGSPKNGPSYGQSAPVQPAAQPVVQRVVHAVADQMPGILATVYVAVYLAVGVAAIVTWVGRPDVTSDLVKNVATTFIGLVLPIVGSFFHLQQ
jgi:hypothetical protein